MKPLYNVINENILGDLENQIEARVSSESVRKLFKFVIDKINEKRATGDRSTSQSAAIYVKSVECFLSSREEKICDKLIQDMAINLKSAQIKNEINPIDHIMFNIEDRAPIGGLGRRVYVEVLIPNKQHFDVYRMVLDGRRHELTAAQTKYDIATTKRWGYAAPGEGKYAILANKSLIEEFRSIVFDLFRFK